MEFYMQLQNLEATEFIDLVKKAAGIFNKYPKSTSKRNPEYNELDEKFYIINQIEEEGLTKLNRLQINYFKKNLDLIK